MAEENDKLCSVCWAEGMDKLVEPVLTSCGHMLCWPCLYRSASHLRNKSCPTCRQEVTHVTPMYQLGIKRREEHEDIPPRPEAGVDPFINVDFREVRRSSRQRTTNIRLRDIGPSGLDLPVTLTDGDDPAPRIVPRFGQSAIRRPLSPERVEHSQEFVEHSQDRVEHSQDRVEHSQESVEHSQERVRSQEFVEQRGSEGDQSARRDPRAAESGSIRRFNVDGTSYIQDYGAVDMDEDEDMERRLAETTGNDGTPTETRFTIKDKIPGSNLTYLAVVIQEVEVVMLAKQTTLKKLNATLVAKTIQRKYPLSFPSNNPVHLHGKPTKSVARIVSNGLERAISKYKQKVEIMNRSGNSGPPETEQERSLRTIIDIDYTAAHAPVVRNRPNTVAGGHIPTILDPQPIVPQGIVGNRSFNPLSASERGAADASLNLDRPVVDNQATYRQQRASQARLGAQIREDSLTEHHQRKNPPNKKFSTAATSILSDASSTLEGMSSQGSNTRGNMEAFLMHNMQSREADRDMNREERKIQDAKDKIEHDRQEKIEKEDKEKKEQKEREEILRREAREDKKLEIERLERQRMNLVMMKMLGGFGAEQEPPKKQVIKVLAKVEEEAESQPLPAKFKLSNLETLLRNLNEYMSESVGSSDSTGILLEEDDDAVIVTDVDQLDGFSSFLVEKKLKRGKSYWNLKRN